MVQGLDNLALTKDLPILEGDPTTWRDPEAAPSPIIMRAEGDPTTWTAPEEDLSPTTMRAVGDPTTWRALGEAPSHTTMKGEEGTRIRVEVIPMKVGA